MSIELGLHAFTLSLVAAALNSAMSILFMDAELAEVEGVVKPSYPRTTVSCIRTSDRPRVI